MSGFCKFCYWICWPFRWLPGEDFMLAMASIGRDKSSQRCAITHPPIGWLYVLCLGYISSYYSLLCFLYCLWNSTLNFHDLKIKVKAFLCLIMNIFHFPQIINKNKILMNNNNSRRTHKTEAASKTWLLRLQDSNKKLLSLGLKILC